MGGRSRRFGSDKALLEIDGRTLMDRNIDLLAGISPPTVLVASGAIPAQSYRCKTATDIYPETGPLGGIITGLNALGEGWHVVLACDMPAVQPDLLKLLISRCSESVDAVIPEVDGYLEPLCAIYSHRALGPLREYLESGGRAMHKSLGHLTILRVEESDLRVVDHELESFVNINTIEDWHKWRKASSPGADG